MNLPIEMKCLIADFLFSKEETFNQHVPSKAIELAKADREQVIKLRSLCTGSANFLGKRFKISHTLDRLALVQARQQLTFSILKFKHCHNKWFEMPRLKSQHTCMKNFVFRHFEYFDTVTFKMHNQTVDRLFAEIVKLRQKQAALLRLGKRAPH